MELKLASEQVGAAKVAAQAAKAAAAAAVGHPLDTASADKSLAVAAVQAVAAARFRQLHAAPAPPSPSPSSPSPSPGSHLLFLTASSSLVSGAYKRTVNIRIKRLCKLSLFFQLITKRSGAIFTS